MNHALSHGLQGWLDEHAESLDTESRLAPEVLPRLADEGLFRIGVPAACGGSNGDARDAIEAMTAVAEHSLSAAFVFWGQRVFIEYLLHSPNAALRERWLPDLLAGRCAGASGLSNAMKFLSGIEALQVTATPATSTNTAGAPTIAPHPAASSSWQLDGRVPWATNLQPGAFIVAIAVAARDGGAPMIVAVPHDRPGVSRSADLDLIALRGTRTAALTITAAPIDERDLIHADAPAFLPHQRPVFLAMQCTFAIGLARRALAAAEAVGGAARPVLEAPIRTLRRTLTETVDALHAGLADQRFVTQAAELFKLRIRLADIVQQAVLFELQASGGRAYHRDQPLAFARHWREAAFIPIVTPSLTQLQGELLKHGAQSAAAAAPA